MRVAFVGKGGVGKSAIVGTLARVLARRGEQVLVVDSDPMPGLAYSVGMAPTDMSIPDDAVEERPEGGEGRRFRLRSGLSAAEAVDRYALRAPAGVRVLQFGKMSGPHNSLVRSQAAFSQILDELPVEGWTLIGDLPGGTRQPFLGWADYADTLLIVVEPTAKSILSARRLARVALREGGRQRIRAVVSKARAATDAATVSAATSLEIVGIVPWDEELAEAERRSAAPIDHAPGSSAVLAIESLADRLAEEVYL
ncbi:MAG: nucleotide-binding protein [Acidimicrobiales bacterium]